MHSVKHIIAYVLILALVDLCCWWAGFFVGQSRSETVVETVETVKYIKIYIPCTHDIPDDEALQFRKQKVEVFVSNDTQ